jgi:hypothetical protein
MRGHHFLVIGIIAVIIYLVYRHGGITNLTNAVFGETSKIPHTVGPDEQLSSTLGTVY